ncbi:MAG: hypothetical protein ACE5G8_04505, partial [Anaerolineae bacterium]
TALAQGPGYAEVVKTASHDSAAKEMTVTYTIDVHPTGMGGGIVDVLDELPPELGFEGVLEADSSVIQPTFNPNTRQLTFQVNLDSGHSARLRYRARVLPQAECGADLINPVQVLVNGDPIGEPGEARLHIACSDLGDAPTSNNHFGAAMDAFPPTPAFYPTVFDPLAAGPTGPGPFHYNAELMHLGRMVSFEREADLGPDTDPTNNILPLLNIPNQDEFDDGLLNLPNLDFAHCQTATLLVEVATATATGPTCTCASKKSPNTSSLTTPSRLWPPATRLSPSPPPCRSSTPPRTRRGCALPSASNRPLKLAPPPPACNTATGAACPAPCSTPTPALKCPASTWAKPKITAFPACPSRPAC